MKKTLFFMMLFAFLFIGMASANHTETIEKPEIQMIFEYNAPADMQPADIQYLNLETVQVIYFAGIVEGVSVLKLPSENTLYSHKAKSTSYPGANLDWYNRSNYPLIC